MSRDNAAAHFKELHEMLDEMDLDSQDSPLLAPHEWIRVGELFSMLSPSVEQMRIFWQGFTDRREAREHK